MCKKSKKFGKQKAAKSVQQQIYEDYIEYGSAYLSAKSDKQRELYQELLNEPDKINLAKEYIGHGKIKEEALRDARSCIIEAPCTQTAVDATIMIICVIILSILNQFIFSYDEGRMLKVRTYILEQFGDPNAKAKQSDCGFMSNGEVCEIKIVYEKSLMLLAAQVLKPVFVLVVRWFKGEMANSQLFTHSIFITRLGYDIGFILLSFKYLADVKNFVQLQYQLSLLPLYLELLIWFCSVRTALRNTQKVRFRQMRSRIKTKRQNDLMWSTDEDSELEEELNKLDHNRVDWFKDLRKKRFDDSSSEEDVYDTQTKTRIMEADHIIKGTPVNDAEVLKNEIDNDFLRMITSNSQGNLNESKSSKVESDVNEQNVNQQNVSKCCKKAVADFDPRVGPFDVFISKMHKPSFICFVDLMMAATFFIGSSAFFLIKFDMNVTTKWDVAQNNKEKMKEQSKSIVQQVYNLVYQIIDEVLSFGIFFLQVMLFVKFWLDKFYFKCCAEEKHRNRSKTVINLFRIRIAFDAVVLFFYFKFFMKNDHHSTQSLKTINFRTFYVLFPILLIEFLIYKYSVLPAYDRYAYQKISVKRFKDNKLVWLKGRADPTRHLKKIDKFVEKIQRNVDNAEIIGMLNENEYIFKDDRQSVALQNDVADRKRQEMFAQAENIMVPLIECSQKMACFITFLNAIWTPLGTLLAVFVDNRFSINPKVLLLCLVQALIYYIAHRLMQSPNNDKKEANDDRDIGVLLDKFVWFWGIIYGLIIHQYNNILQSQLAQLLD